MCLGLLTDGSSQVQSQNWKHQQIMKQIMKQIMTQHNAVFFCGKMLGKSPVFFLLGYVFFVSMTVTVGFGPVDGGFLTGPKSKLETTTNHETNHETNHVWNKMLFFFVARCWEGVQFF